MIDEQHARRVGQAFTDGIQLAGNMLNGWDYVLLAWPRAESGEPHGIIRISNIAPKDVVPSLAPIVMQLVEVDERERGLPDVGLDAYKGTGKFTQHKLDKTSEQEITAEAVKYPKPDDRNTIGRIQLDIAAAHGCQTPDCTHEAHGEGEIFLNQTCHPRESVEVAYERGTGMLRLICSKCRRLLVYVRVAS